MREIKFRVWDILNKRILNYGEIMTLPMWEVLPGTPEQRAFNVMQYTGLKDKNGKEIYEGDIVKQTYHKEKYEESFDGYHIGEVVLITSGVCIKKPLIYELEKDRFVKLDGYKNVAGYRSEVIGNIYENPELLEGN